MAHAPHRCNDPNCQLRDGSATIDVKKLEHLNALKSSMSYLESFESVLKVTSEISKIQATMSIDERLAIYIMKYFMDLLVEETDDDNDDDGEVSNDRGGGNIDFGFYPSLNETAFLKTAF
ncbi:hypothetical protein Cantr_02437 [Candida viswanathii]|jgi:hypothetical protein|uniref:Uncharacterized protein n=1 Tax=Candida viswanathii TaxID=5486 RepID=A0A367YME7_9ASCO|nr:hypothetical protein Cantr_02437 [Candida viswanathii]